MSNNLIGVWYKGFHLRSRIEGRWCVFFDCMEIEWQYELEGYKLDKLYYLPDFWLPQVNMFAEVKSKQFTAEEIDKCWKLTEATRFSCMMLVGIPDFKEYPATEYDAWCDGFWTVDYALVDRFLETEHRFPAMNYASCPEMFGERYAAAVLAARSARFEHGEKPWTITSSTTSKLAGTAAR